MAVKLNQKQQEESLDPSRPSAAYETMFPKWSMIETLLAGTAAMREAGELYLPKHTAEEDEDYEARLAQTTLYNVTELTLNSLVGRVFQEPMEINEDVPQRLKDLMPNMDSCGNNFSFVCQNWFKEAMAKGFAHILVDMPALSEDQRANRTLADDMRENRRPYWSIIKPENLIFAYQEEVNGVDTLTHVRIVEIETEKVNFAEFQSIRIRILEPGRWELWRNENEGTTRKAKWVMDSEGVSDLPVIPLVTFYTAPTGFMLAKPPLEDLAYLNIAHWQSSSDQRNVLTVARFPIMAASGTSPEAGKGSIKVGPRKLLSVRDPSGRYYYVEHTGKAIGAGKEDLEKLEDQMAAYGAEFLRRQVAGRTAFERAADQGEAISPLRDMALRFQDAIKRGLDLTAMWLNIEGGVGGTVKINTDYTEEQITNAQLSTMASARERGDLSRRSWLTAMKSYGLLPDDFDVDAEIELVKQEVKDGVFPPMFYKGLVSLKAPPGEMDPTVEAANIAADATKEAAKNKPPAAPPAPAPQKAKKKNTA